MTTREITRTLTDSSTLAEVGGKGLALGRLVRAGFRVPTAVVLTTRAYQHFIAANQLAIQVDTFVEAWTKGSRSLAETSSAIRQLFRDRSIPSEIAAEILQAVHELPSTELGVAVRSSATAEDLPHLSFAGQQESYLNVVGKEALLRAVSDCWASLWTERALDYRRKMQIGQRGVAMAVVIQMMVAADVAGVLFTANPTNGCRTECVLNASYGLGESMVSGHVTPDAFVINRETGEVQEKVLGSKPIRQTPAAEGITSEAVSDELQRQFSLTDQTVGELVKLGCQVETALEAGPQDIEWARRGDEFWILQSRAITNLPPAPLKDVRWDPPQPKAVLIRRQVVENMPDPLSPLFDELYLQVGLENSVDHFVDEFGIRFNIDEFVERPMFLTVNGYAYCRGSYRYSWKLMWVVPVIFFDYFRVLPRILRNLTSDWNERSLPEYRAEIDSWRSRAVSSMSWEELLEGILALSNADAKYWFRVSLVVGAAKCTDALLDGYLKSRLVPGELTSGMFLRGYPSQTISAQGKLESIAREIRADPDLAEQVKTAPHEELPSILDRSPSGPPVAGAIEAYFEEYGHQVYSLDFVEPTQIENREPVFLAIKTLVRQSKSDIAASQTALLTERDSLAESTAASLGPVRRWLFRKFLKWAQTYVPHREEALFYMGYGWPTLRQLALELGSRLQSEGLLATAADVFFLELVELRNALESMDASKTDLHFSELAAGRKSLRESRKRLHPPGIIPQGARWKIAFIDFSMFETQKQNDDKTQVLNGFAVSPGRVTGIASVIHSPDDFDKMRPESILVCPTTTPAWTPLFSQASGLVTDIGGILAHGSIVAREYGLPAVLGTGNATQRITSGQKVEVDGIAGTVTLLD